MQAQSALPLRSKKLTVNFRSSDGLTLLMSSSDGFCSNLSFAPGELGQTYTGQVPNAHHPSPAISTASSAHATPNPTPIASTAPPLLEKQPPPGFPSSNSPGPTTARSTTPSTQPPAIRPPTPARSNSNSSVATQSGIITSNPTPSIGTVPGVAAANSSFSSLPWTTPPQTPMTGIISGPSSVSGSVLGKRDTSESEKEDHAGVPKKRRVAPTLIKPDEEPNI